MTDRDAADDSLTCGVGSVMPDLLEELPHMLSGCRMVFPIDNLFWRFYRLTA